MCLPDWMHSALNHGVFDDVVVPPVPLKVTVKAGDPVGFLGAQDLADEDNYPQIITTDYKAHIELLSLDEHVTDVVANVKGIKTGKQFIKLKLKRPLYLRNGEGEESTFEQMSAITRADAGKIIPRDATYPFTDKTGVTYFQIRPHTWVHQDDVEQLSQHDLAGLNFDCIKAEHTTDFTRTLDERWVIDALKSISSHFDSEKGPASAQAKMFYDSLIHNAENRRPPDPYPDKSQDELLFGALHTNQMNIPEYARRLIVKHDSDWHSTREDTRWSSVFKARDESPVVQLANGGFLDATRWMDKVPPFASQRSVWHFHPLEFLEAINPKGNCACGRDITLDELCDIAPKADKDNYDLVVLIAMFLCGSSFANDEYFSCDTAKGIIKLDVNKDELQYTLTKGRKSEFTYESKGNDFSGFKYNHYSRFQTDYLNVSFVNAGYKYTMFSNYEDENESRGVSVTNLKTKKESVYDCKSVGIDRLSDLSSKLACDKDSALGCE